MICWAVCKETGGVFFACRGIIWNMVCAENRSLGAQTLAVPWWKIVPVVPRQVVKISPPVLVCEDKWEDFVSAANVGSVKVAQYYLGRPAPSHRVVVFGDRNVIALADMSNEDYGNIIAGLFADAVEVGALVLPDEYDVGDFSFKVIRKRKGAPSYARAGYRRVRVTFQNNPKYSGEVGYVQECVEEASKMSGLYEWAPTLEHLAGALDEVITLVNK